eukprot:2359004-Alexandrium_andersonii.AAC.1
MSASLVGSEMCIRDRLLAQLLQGAYRPCRPRPKSASGALPPEALFGGSGAVSYTHLTLPTICSV